MKYFLIFCQFFILFGSIYAADAKLTAHVNKQKLAVGEQFQVTFSLNGKGDNFKAPSFADFNFLGGPSQSTSMQIINGAMSQSISFTYYLSPKKEGVFTINAATIVSDGKKVESNSVKIEAVKGNASKQQSQNNQQNQRAQRGASQNGQISEKELADNIFMRTSVNKSKVYQGEQVLVTYKLYRRLDVLQYQVNEMPKYNGFWKEDVKTDNQNYVENLDGIQYNVTEIKRSVLIPQRSGSLVIDPLDITCVVRLKGRRSNNIFDDFFGMGGYQDINFGVKGKGLKLEVLPLPSNKPDGYNGAVGSFNLSAKADRNKLKSNEAINFKVTINGKGNLKLIDPFELKLPPEIEAYEPKTLDKINVSSAGIAGSRTFEYLLIPRHSGKYKIPAISFSYFDTDTKTFKSLSSNEIDLDVEKGTQAEDESAANVTTSMSKEDVVSIGNDIRFIKTESNFKSQANLFFGSKLFYFLLALPFVTLISVFVFKDELIPTNANKAEYRIKRAASIAQKHMEVAQQFLTNNKNDEFYNETLKAINGYLIDRFSLKTANLNKASVEEVLTNKNVSEPLIKQLLEVINQCEFARFSPSSSQTAKESFFNETVSVIEKIESSLKA